MDVLLPFLVFAAGLAMVMAALWRLAARARRRGIGSPMMSVVDEIFHPIALDAQVEIRVQEERKVPLPSPDDKDK